MLFGLDALALAPTLIGGAEFADVLRITEAGAVGAAAFANATGIEVLELAAEGNAVGLADAFVAATSNINVELTVRGGAGDDTVDSTLLAVGRDLAVEFGDGDDLLLGGAADESVRPGSGDDYVSLGTGSDRVEFAANELTAFDVVVADTLAGDCWWSRSRRAGRSAPPPSPASRGSTPSSSPIPARPRCGCPSNLVTQSGQASVLVDATGSGDLVLDGRAMTSFLTTVEYSGGTGTTSSSAAPARTR